MNALECPDNHAPTSWLARDGGVWFATRAGAVRVDPEAPRPVGAPPLIEELTVDGARVGAAAAGQPVVLPAGRHRLDVSFTSPTFLAPAAVAFRYRLDGFDADWVPAGTQRQAEYTGLPPGAYLFHVAAAGEDRSWREAAPLALRLRPHLWQTLPFYLACAALAAGLGAALVRARVRRVQARLALVLAERNRISRELHDNLSARLLGLKLQLDAAARRLEDAPAAARAPLDEARAELPQSLAETRRAIWMLRAEALERGKLADALAECARQITAGTETRAEVSADASLALPADVEEPLLRIAQEALGNAVRHGASRRIDVRLHRDGGYVRLEIEDDGRGLATDAPGASEGHYGLVGMRERARLVGGRLEVGAGASGGTRVGVEVPLGRWARWWRRVA
jgi:signal transduction histidine kinase